MPCLFNLYFKCLCWLCVFSAEWWWWHWLATEGSFPTWATQPEVDPGPPHWCWPAEHGQHVFPKFSPAVFDLHCPIYQLHVDTGALQNMYDSLCPCHQCVWVFLSCLFSKKTFVPFVPSTGHEPGFCMMCTMQNHVIQVFANTGNVIKPIGVLNELKSKWEVFTQSKRQVVLFVFPFWRESFLQLFDLYILH